MFGPKIALAIFVSASLALSNPLIASATDAEQGHANAVASTALSLAPSLPSGADIASSSDGTFSAHDNVQAVQLPSSTDGQVSLTTDHGRGLKSSFKIGLPGANRDSVGKESQNGVVVYASADQSAPDVVADSVAGGVRIQTVINQARTSETFVYTLSADVTPELQADGSILLLRANGEGAQILGTVAPAWAFDAQGKTVPTHYEVRGAAFAQVVEHQTAGVVYPVVADPTVTQINAFQFRIRWNRSETATIAGGGWAATGGAGACTIVGTGLGGPVIGGIAGAACLVATGTIVYQAGVAQNSNPKRCVQMTFTNVIVAPPFPWVDSYACR